MTKKKRIPIPIAIAANVLFASDRTCCVCNEKGKSVQIHHINEDPSNNHVENLAVLCLQCHDDTMIKGGFGRKLNAESVTLYRNAWLARVKSRKERADELASIHTVTGTTETNTIILTDLDSEWELETNNDPNILKEYLTEILSIHKGQMTISQAKWDSGITTKMNDGNSNLIDFYEEVLSELATFLSPGQFENKSPKLFFSNFISQKFTWYWAINEPSGPGTGGRMAFTIIGGLVINDLQKMVIEMITTLVAHYNLKNHFEGVNWKAEWGLPEGQL